MRENVQLPVTGGLVALGAASVPLLLACGMAPGTIALSSGVTALAAAAMAALGSRLHGEPLTARGTLRAALFGAALVGPLVALSVVDGIGAAAAVAGSATPSDRDVVDRGG